MSSLLHWLGGICAVMAIRLVLITPQHLSTGDDYVLYFGAVAFGGVAAVLLLKR
jgi:hypothetical protein